MPCPPSDKCNYLIYCTLSLRTRHAVSLLWLRNHTMSESCNSLCFGSPDIAPCQNATARLQNESPLEKCGTFSVLSARRVPTGLRIKNGCAYFDAPLICSVRHRQSSALRLLSASPLTGAWKRGSPCQFKRLYVVGPSSSERTSSLSSTFTILESSGVNRSLLNSGKKLAAMFCLY